MRPSIPSLSAFSATSSRMCSTPRKRSALILGVTCAALLGSATTQSAQAEWVLDHIEAPGNITYTAGSAPGIAPVNISEPLSDHNGWGWAGSIAAPTGWSPQRVEATNAVDGQVRAVFKWQSFEMPGMPGGGQAPPEYVTFKVIAGCFATAIRDTGENTLPHNATGEVAEAKIMDVDGTPSPEPHGTTKVASTIQYKTVAVENGYATSPWVEIKASAKIGPNRYKPIPMFEGEIMEDPLTGGVGVGWQISFSDPHEKYVLISSGIETSYYKHYQFGLPVPEPHVRADDGSIEVDSVAYKNSDGTWNCGGLEFLATVTGSWSSTTNPGTTLDWSGMDSYSPPIKVPSGGVYYGLEQSIPDSLLPYTTTLTVDANDPQDGFKAKSSYKITWHKPMENPTVDSTLQNAYVEYPLQTYLQAEPNDDAEATVYPVQAITKLGADTYTWVTVAGGAVVAYSPGWFGLSTKAAALVVGALAVSGYGVSVIVPAPKTASLSNDYAQWTRAVNATLEPLATNDYISPPELAATVTLTPQTPHLDSAWASCLMSIVRRQHYTDTFFHYDAYGFNGYEGNQQGINSTPGIHEDYGFYTQQTQQNNP